MPMNLLTFIRSLSFGGLVGCGLAIGLYLRYPLSFADNIRFESIVILGMLLGAAAHRAIDTIIVKGVLSPIGRFATYYGKFVQVELLARTGLISEALCKRIKDELTTEYFLGWNFDDSTAKGHLVQHERLKKEQIQKAEKLDNGE